MKELPCPAHKLGNNNTFIKRLIVATVLINLSVIALASVSLYRNRLEHREQAEVNTRNLSHVLEQYVIGVFDRIDLVLSAVEFEARKGILGRSLDSQAINSYMRRERAHLDEIHDLKVVNAQGEAIYSFGAAMHKPLNVADRDYFIRLRGAPEVESVISKPVVGRLSGKWYIIVARRINQPDGTFAGVVTASISLERLYKIFSTVNVGKHGSIVLRDADLGLVLRYPELAGVDNVVGSNPAREFGELVQTGQTSDTYTARSFLDNVERTFCYRRVSGYPFYVVVGLATTDYLAEWQSEAVKEAAFVAFFCLITSIAAWLACREWQRKNSAMQDLIRQKAIYHTIADYTHAWEFWLDPEERFVYSSPSCKRVTGYEAAAFYADPDLLRKIILPEDLDKCSGHHHDARPDGDSGNLVIRIRHGDGSVRWLEHICQSIIDESGTYLGTRGSNRDITERKQMEEALIEIGEHFHQIFMQNWDAVLLLKQENLEVIDANPAMVELFGYSLTELQALGPWQVIPDTTGEIHRFAQDAAQGGEPFLGQTVGTSKDGRQITISTKAKLIRLGEVDAIYCSFRDISERIRLEMERQKNQAKLIHANKMTSLGMLVSGIAHEINNPNQYISINALLLEDIWKDALAILARHQEEHGEFLLKGLPFDQAREAVPRLLNGLSEGSRRITLIVNNLKDFSRDDSGRHESTFDLNKTVQDALQILTHHIHKHTDEFRIDLAEELPLVKGRPQQIEQVIINLITNALQALPDKTRGVRVSTAFEQQDGCIVLAVSDQGSGMTSNLMERITEPFFSTKLDQGGTGLGLSISATIIKEHGGTLEFESEPGLGTTATIRLPATQENMPGNTTCQQALTAD